MKFTKGGFIMRRQWSEMNRNKCAKIYDAKQFSCSLQQLPVKLYPILK